MRGWRWILIIEGIPTIILGIATYWWLADSVETAGYLSEEEKAFLVKRRGREVTNTTSAQAFHWADVKKCFTDWKCWALYVAPLPRFETLPMTDSWIQCIRTVRDRHHALRFQHFLTHHHQSYRPLVQPASASTNNSLLRSRRDNLPPRCTTIRRTPEARSLRGNLLLYLHRRIRDTAIRCVQRRALSGVLLGCHGTVCCSRTSTGMAAKQLP
jgi:hypothetical protein